MLRKFCSKVKGKNLNYYEILGVSSQSSIQDIKDAYNSLAKQLHPDSSQQVESKDSKDQFIKVVEAYKTLSDLKERAAYDSLIFGKMA